MANRIDPYQMQYFVVSDLCLHCLLILVSPSPCGTYSQGSKVIPQRQKSHRVQCIFMFTKTIIIKIIVYIFIMFTSFESLMIYVIYIVILIRFFLCKLERQRSKFCIRDFGQFLSDVNIDVNGTLPFLKFPLNLNNCI